MVAGGARRRRGLGTVADVALVGLVLLIALIVMGPYLYTVSPTLVAGGERLKPPSMAHPLGTDQFGREVLARVIAGGHQAVRGATLTPAPATGARRLLG